ncbi:calcineurin binding protein, putative [Talaromyces stipitatus ATCC 10500]|uniref:Calcineurin binding protein, putative n=1 Tax=Talaromyces stipitatus (strain ATCC 10500 / CBS 375.48 / QM 6759 / NRRL 1006) TaxID=441959 RepID=B8M3N9_TALSN|nr:calcineurin binding protein, putative [Talaromyces stipitatus ATCC 10500]EED22411.1 calcineurin binding protein, putative [Talaromyces stipitatus ATCC 10500]
MTVAIASTSLQQSHARIRKFSERNNKMASVEASSNQSSPRPKPALTLDLSNLPPLSRPSPPSNTLIITELHNLLVFQPASLTSIREKIISIAPLNSFSPLPSFRRIVCSFLSVDDAVKVRQGLESSKTVIDECGLRARIYFGEPTPIIENTEEAKRKKLLEAPHSQKMFFISPPPSPPHGWVVRNEEPPNKEVHASDLADALAKLGTQQQQQQQQQQTTSDSDPLSPVSVVSSAENNQRETTPGVTRSNGSWPSSAGGAGGRSRSSTLIYHPNDHGGSPNLPAVMVEDTSIGEDDDAEDDDLMLMGGGGKILAHTARPPVELMH